MAFVTSSFSGATVKDGRTAFTGQTAAICTQRTATPRPIGDKARIVALASPIVDEYMASSVHRQYIEKACPSGVPSLQCIEGATSDQPYAARTLKRQSQLRYRQQPANVRLRTYFDMRRAAVVAAHGCSHEEQRALQYPTMAAAYVLGQAEASKACVRYFHPNNPAEVCMRRSVDNQFAAKVNPAGVFTTACTDGQARYEAYLMQLRGKSAEFRARQYSTFEKEAMKFAARKQALVQKGHCTSEEIVYIKYPIVASAMRPVVGYYPPFVSSPTQGYTLGVARPSLSTVDLSGVAETYAKILQFIMSAPSRLPVLTHSS